MGNPVPDWDPENTASVVAPTAAIEGSPAGRPDLGPEREQGASRVRRCPGAPRGSMRGRSLGVRMEGIGERFLIDTHDRTLKMSYRIKYMDDRGQGWSRIVPCSQPISEELIELEQLGCVVVSIEVMA